MDTKQIFDWLREQIAREKVSEYDKEDASFNLGLSNAISKVYRAEAKWEAECCEWEVAPYYLVSKCVRKLAIADVIAKEFKFCPYCGRKISVVE